MVVTAKIIDDKNIAKIIFFILNGFMINNMQCKKNELEIIKGYILFKIVIKYK